LFATKTKRWKKAQKAEKNYWISSRKIWLRQNSKEFGPEMLTEGFNLDQNFFANKAVLEVGCGPNGIVYQINNAKSSIGLDPLELSDQLINGHRNERLIRGLGEIIPFQDNSFDVILSFNSIDHSFNPRKVIEEIYRILKPKGDFLLWVYILRDKFYFLKPVLDKLDAPHPYHFTYSEITGLLKDYSFVLATMKRKKGTVLKNNALKKMAGNCMLDTLWLRMTKEN
jgi:SAM-dependent methyltransferase